MSCGTDDVLVGGCWRSSETTAERLLTAAAVSHANVTLSQSVCQPIRLTSLCREACLHRWREHNHSCLLLKQIVWGTFLFFFLLQCSNGGPIIFRYADEWAAIWAVCWKEMLYYSWVSKRVCVCVCGWWIVHVCPYRTHIHLQRTCFFTCSSVFETQAVVSNSLSN